MYSQWQTISHIISDITLCKQVLYIVTLVNRHSGHLLPTAAVIIHWRERGPANGNGVCWHAVKRAVLVNWWHVLITVATVINRCCFMTQ